MIRGKDYTKRKAKGVLWYPGGKQRGYRHIVKYFPQDIEIMASPFLGGGGIELNMAAHGVRVYGYDSYKPLVAFWSEALRDAQELAERVRSYYPMKRCEFKLLRDRLEHIEDMKEMAAIFFALNRSAYGGKLGAGCGFAKGGFTESSIYNLSNFSVPNISVDCMDFRDSIALHPNDFLYLDPPYPYREYLYERDTKRTETTFDHTGLSEILKRRDNWILSYSDHPLIMDLYKGYHIEYPKYVYGIHHNFRPSNEVLIFSSDIDWSISLDRESW